jgi:hypothetical protein
MLYACLIGPFRCQARPDSCGINQRAEDALPQVPCFDYFEPPESTRFFGGFRSGKPIALSGSVVGKSNHAG